MVSGACFIQNHLKLSIGCPASWPLDLHQLGCLCQHVAAQAQLGHRCADGRHQLQWVLRHRTTRAAKSWGLPQVTVVVY